MARTREFCPDACLDRAVEVFARQGYAGTSIGDLTDALGIGRQSLYDTYGDKRALLDAALERAAQGFVGAAALNAPNASGRQALEAFLAAIVGECTDANHPGCLVSNLLLEQGLSDASIASALQQRWKATRAALKKTVVRGQRDLSIRADRDADALADALMALMAGLRVAARAKTSATALRRMSALTLNALLN
jgi:TetR/AcrR family transcriptional regulator, transcriptional repressor for nem operon